MTPTDDSRWIAPMPLGALSAPRVLLVAGAAQRAEALAAIVEVGGAAVGPVEFGPGAELIARRAHEAVLVELCDDEGDTLDALLDSLDEAAARGTRAIVTLPERLIDPVAARISAPSVTLLCGPGHRERRDALALALAPPAAMLNDIDAMRLREMSEEMGRMARALATLSLPNGAIDGEDSSDDELPAPGAEIPFAVEASAIRTMIRARRLRAQYFDTDLFADPAWDMLLDLTAARLEGTPVAVSSLCIAAAVPPTTALRWIKTLTDAGLLIRIADPRDRRRVFIRLADDAAARMLAYLSAATRMLPNTP